MSDFARDSGRDRNVRRSDGRIPPHNLNAEESLLGALLLSRDVVDLVGEMDMLVEHFYKPSHQHIYAAIRSLAVTGLPVDAVTVADELRRNGLLDEIGGPSTLLELQNATPAISNASRYAKIVQDTAMLRRLIGVAGDIAEIAYLEPDDVTKALDEAETKVFEVAEERVKMTTVRSLSDLLPLAMDKLQETFERGDIITGIATGFNDLDELLSGLQPSTLNIIGARPAMGKTSLGLGIAAHVAQTTRRPVLIFSLEMGHTELTQRILSSEAEVDSQKLRTGRLVEADWTKIGRAINRLDVPLFLDDNPRVTVMEIRAKARRMKARQGLALIVIDYLQLMSGGATAENRQLEVSEISRGLKILARELELPIVALSQLSRNLETRGDKRPMLSDLRESGCLTAETRLLRADTNAEVTLGELVATGATGVPVWSLDEHYRLVRGTVTAAFSSGVKPVFRLTFATGRSIDASANHPFLTIDGWVRVEDLRVGAHLATTHFSPSVDAIPRQVWNHVRHKALPSAAMTTDDLAASIGVSYCGSILFKSDCSRGRLERVAAATGDEWLFDLARSEVLWDRIIDIEPLGEMEVFDATVEPHHNFVANGVVAHNSLEQDADVVMFLYRDEVYNKESTDKAMAEVIIAKHRSGPTGTVRLVFRGQYTKFGNAARGV